MAYLARDDDNTTDSQVIARVYALDTNYEKNDRVLTYTVTSLVSGNQWNGELSIDAGASYSKGFGVKNVGANQGYKFNVTIKAGTTVLAEFEETFYTRSPTPTILSFALTQNQPLESKSVHCEWSLSNTISGTTIYAIYASANDGDSWFLKTTGFVNDASGSADVGVDEFKEYSFELRVSTNGESVTLTKEIDVVPPRPTISNFRFEQSNEVITIKATLSGVIEGLTKMQIWVRISKGEFVYLQTLDAVADVNVNVTIPNTGYYDIAILAYNSTYTSTAAMENQYINIAPKPAAWNWNETPQRQSAYMALTAKGKTTDFSFDVWNEFIEKVKELETYVGQTSENLDNAKSAETDKTFAAQKFNLVVSAIKAMNSGLLIVDKSPGEKVYGEYIVTMAEKLNEIIDRS